MKLDFTTQDSSSVCFLFLQVRVCEKCCVEVDNFERKDRLEWRDLRVQSFLDSKLIPYFEPVVDRSVDKVMRIAEGALYVVKNTLILNYPASIAINAIETLRRYGMSGLAGVLMRKDFVDAVETLKRISGMDKAYPISLQELTACIYYKIALERGLRGCNSDTELNAHAEYTESECREKLGHLVSHSQDEDSNFIFEYEKRGQSASSTDSSGRISGQEEPTVPGKHNPPSADGKKCCRATDGELEDAIRFAPIALDFVYNKSPVDTQRLASSQGWTTLYIKDSTEPEQPAFALFASPRVPSADNTEFSSPESKSAPPEMFSKYHFLPSRMRAGQFASTCSSSTSKRNEIEKIAVLAIRGTSSVHDFVTDIRAAPMEFPPGVDEIRESLYGPKSKGPGIFATSPTSSDETSSKSSLLALQAIVDSFVRENATATRSESSPRTYTSQDELDKEWEWLNNAQSMTYASGGVARAAIWILAETGPSLHRLLEDGYSLKIVGHSLGELRRNVYM